MLALMSVINREIHNVKIYNRFIIKNDEVDKINLIKKTQMVIGGIIMKDITIKNEVVVSTEKENEVRSEVIEKKEVCAMQYGIQYPELQHIVDEARRCVEKYNCDPLNTNLSFIYRVLNPLREMWVSDDGYIHCTIDKLKSQEIGQAFRIAEILQSADTGLYSVVLEIYNPYEGIKKLPIIPMSISVKDLEKVLCDNACIVLEPKKTHSYFRHILDYAMNKAEPKLISISGEGNLIKNTIWNVVLGNLPMRSIYHSERIGWDKDRNTQKLIFKGQHIYTENGEYSDYKGNFLIGKNGDYNTYLTMLKTEVVGNTPLEAALGFAASATLLKFMNEKFALHLDNPIVHLYNNSTSGKTTCFRLMTSFGGQPITSEDESVRGSLFSTFGGTTFSLLKSIGNNSGFPCGFDELSTSEMTDKEKERVLYIITGGLDKKRLLRDGSGLQKGVSFSTTILTNGEQTIMPNNGVKQGFIVRVFEFSCVSWTRDGEHAKRIESVCLKNNGFVTPMLAQYLLKLDEKQLKGLENKYYYWKRNCIRCAEKRLLNDQYTERLSKVFALFMISLECVGKVTGLKLHFAEVFEFLFAYVIREKADNSCIGVRAYNYLLRRFNENRDAFWHNTTSGPVGEGKRYLGALIDKRAADIEANGYGKFKSTRCIGLDIGQAKEIFIKQGDFSDVKVIMNEFNKMGVLSVKDKARETAKDFIFGNEKVKNGYQIYIPEDAIYGYGTDVDGDREIIEF